MSRLHARRWRGLLAVATLMLLAPTRVSADALYRVTDLGPLSEGLLQDGSTILGDLNVSRRLRLDDAGDVTAGTWPSPSSYSGPLPDVITNSPYGARASILAQAGGNAAGWGFGGPDLHWTGFAVLGGKPLVVTPLHNTGFSQALSVNSSGEVVGLSNGQAVYFTAMGDTEAIGTLGGNNSIAYGINGPGQVVGSALNKDGAAHAFTSFHDGAPVDLNKLIAQDNGWSLTSALAVNDAGQVAAFGRNAGGVSHELLFTPVRALDPARIESLAGPTGGTSSQPPPNVPEPSTLLVFGAVAAAAGLRRSR